MSEWAIFSKNYQFAQKTSNSLIFGEQPEDLLIWLIKKEWMSNLKQKVEKNTISVKFFKANCSFFVSERANEQFPQKTSDSRLHSFIMIDLSELLTVALLTWATWAIRSQLLICLEQYERIAHRRSFDLSNWANERWANERIPNPAQMTKFQNLNIWKVLQTFFVIQIAHFFCYLCLQVYNCVWCFHLNITYSIQNLKSFSQFLYIFQFF